jgi:plasmid stabilization system protein ParE
MQILWTTPAAQDFYSITRYIRRDNPSAAREVAKTLYEGCEALSVHRIAGARENSQEPASWCFLPCRILRFIACRAIRLRFFISGTEHKTGRGCAESPGFPVQVPAGLGNSEEIRDYTTTMSAAFVLKDENHQNAAKEVSDACMNAAQQLAIVKVSATNPYTKYLQAHKVLYERSLNAVAACNEALKKVKTSSHEPPPLNRGIKGTDGSDPYCPVPRSRLGDFCLSPISRDGRAASRLIGSPVMGWWKFRNWACRKYPPSPGRPGRFSRGWPDTPYRGSPTRGWPMDARWILI